MNIAVVSPHARYTGNTTIAMLLGMELAARNKTVCISHTANHSNSFGAYLGFKQIDDRTLSSQRLIKMLREGALTQEEVRDYCRPVMNNMEAFSVDGDDLPRSDIEFAIEYMTTSFPYDYMVFDVNNRELKAKSAQQVLKSADLVILVVTQSVTEMSDFAKSRKEILEDIGHLPILVCINKFTDIAGSVKQTAKMMGVIKPNGWFTVRFNPWVQYGGNNGEMAYISSQMRSRDYHVIDLNGDIKTLANGVQKVKVSRRQWVKKNKTEEIKKKREEEQALDEVLRR